MQDDDIRYVEVPTDHATYPLAWFTIGCIRVTDDDDLRRSLDGKLAIVKYSGPKPAQLEAYPDYSRLEMIERCKTSKWSSGDPR